MVKLKVGIVSAAWGARAHLPAWRTLEDVEVVAICTSRRETAEAAAQTHGVERAYWDVGEMAGSDLDIIDVGTRPVLRQEMVLTAIAGGKHVYAGIPFAADSEHAQAMYEAQTNAGVVGVVDAYIQALPGVRLMKEEIAAGRIGDLQTVRCRFALSLFSPRWIGVPSYAWFAQEANGASALRNLGSHALNAMVDLFGPVAEVAGIADTRLKEWPSADGGVVRPQTPDTALALLRFESGVMGELYVAWSAAGAEGFELEAQGSLGRLTASAPPFFPEAFTTNVTLAPLGEPMQPAPPRLLAVPDRLKQVLGSTATAEEPRGAIFPLAVLFRGLVDEVRGTGAATPDFRQALHVQRIVEAVARASAEKAWISVEPF